MHELNIKTENESYTENSIGDKIDGGIATSKIEDRLKAPSVESSETPALCSREPTSPKIKNFVVMAPGSKIDDEKTFKHQKTGFVNLGNQLLKHKPKSNQRKRGILLIDKPISRRIKITKGRSSQDFSKDNTDKNSHFVNTYIDMADQSNSRT